MVTIITSHFLNKFVKIVLNRFYFSLLNQLYLDWPECLCKVGVFKISSTLWSGQIKLLELSDFGFEEVDLLA